MHCVFASVLHNNMPPKGKSEHGGARQNAGRPKGSKNQIRKQASIVKPKGQLTFQEHMEEQRKNGPEVITVEAAREKRAAAEALATEQQERDREKREAQKKEEQKTEQERPLAMQEERKQKEKAAAEALADFRNCVDVDCTYPAVVKEFFHDCG